MAPGGVEPPCNGPLLAIAVADEETHGTAVEWGEFTAVEQGLPPRVMDIDVLRDVIDGLLKDEQPPAE
jgi:hypothetical protein